METLVAWWNSDTGRRIAKWGTTALGALIASGAIPLDMPLIWGLSLGQVLTIFGLGIPSAPPQAIVERQAFAALRRPHDV